MMNDQVNLLIDKNDFVHFEVHPMAMVIVIIMLLNEEQLLYLYHLHFLWEVPELVDKV